MHILVKPIEVRVKCLEGDGLFAETFQIDGDKCHLEEEKSRKRSGGCSCSILLRNGACLWF